MTTKKGFATEVYEIRLDDYHPGEYTNFSEWAKRRNEMIGGYRALAAAERAAGTDTQFSGSWDNMPFVSAELIEADWDNPSTETLAAEGPVDRWALKGTANQLRELYHELLTQLATPAWHWYGMGGDDHAFDYWPNTMRLAVEMRDALLRIAELENSPGFKDPYHTTY